MLKDQVDALVKIAESGENKRTDDLPGNRSLILRMIEGKVLVDRWENITVCFVFNSQCEKFVKEQICKKYNDSDGSNVWGASIIFTEHLPLNKILVMGYPVDIANIHKFESFKLKTIEELCKLENFGRCVAIVPMPEDIK